MLQYAATTTAKKTTKVSELKSIPAKLLSKNYKIDNPQFVLGSENGRQ
jgi:hypothetical protein